jgi:hypothetical protein
LLKTLLAKVLAEFIIKNFISMSASLSWVRIKRSLRRREVVQVAVGGIFVLVHLERRFIISELETRGYSKSVLMTARCFFFSPCLSIAELAAKNRRKNSFLSH